MPEPSGPARDYYCEGCGAKQVKLSEMQLTSHCGSEQLDEPILTHHTSEPRWPGDINLVRCFGPLVRNDG